MATAVNAGSRATLFAISAGAWLAPAAAAEAPRGPVHVALHGGGLAPPDVESRAQAEVTRLYALIGVEIVWVPPTTHDAAVRMVKLTTWEPREDRGSASALGATYGAEGWAETRAYVFWLRVQRYAQRFDRYEMLLGVRLPTSSGTCSRQARTPAAALCGRRDREQVVANGLRISPESAAQIRLSVNSPLASTDPSRKR